MHDQQHDPRHASRAPGQAFTGPRLELPRFQFQTSSTLDRGATRAPQAQPQHAPAPVAQQQHHAPAPQQHYAQPVAQQQYAPAPQPQYAPQQYAQPQYAQPHPQYAPQQAPAPTFHATPTAMQQPVAVTYAAPQPPVQVQQRPMAPRPAPRPTPALANATRPASTISWDRIAPQSTEPTFLQRITPVHMGVLLVLVMVAMVATSGPATMAVKPARLPALASGGGTAGDSMLPSRAGTTAVNAARANGAPAAKVANAPAKAPRARVRARAKTNTAWIRVGNARVRRAVRSGGIPSPAAAANLAIAGGGRVSANSTDSVNLRGIPSAAASEALGPETLPYRPDDGVTLPRMVGERDSHALDSHYGRDTLPMEAQVATPALTPGQSAEQAQQRALMIDMAGSNAAVPVSNGGLFTAH